MRSCRTCKHIEVVHCVYACFANVLCTLTFCVCRSSDSSDKGGHSGGGWGGRRRDDGKPAWKREDKQDYQRGVHVDEIVECGGWSGGIVVWGVVGCCGVSVVDSCLCR